MGIIIVQALQLQSFEKYVETKNVRILKTKVFENQNSNCKCYIVSFKGNSKMYVLSGMNSCVKNIFINAKSISIFGGNKMQHNEPSKGEREGERDRETERQTERNISVRKIHFKELQN